MHSTNLVSSLSAGTGSLYAQAFDRFVKSNDTFDQKANLMVTNIIRTLHKLTRLMQMTMKNSYEK